MLNVVRDPALRELLLRVISSGKPSRERMSLLHAGGHVFDVQAAPMAAQQGPGAIATFHDITELERLERVRRDFVTNISHELRTPLAAIGGYAETLLEGALDDPQNSRRFLEIIAAHTSRLTNLASDLLTLSEIEAGRTSDAAERVSAVEVAEEALHTVAAQANERRILAYLNVADDVYVSGQKNRLQRALSNLLLNAINYNRPGGEVRIDVRRVDETAVISVTDSGIGIASQDIPRVFERFYRVDKARSRQTGGTGLGLSIVRNIAERMGGSVTVTSQMGKGSVFTLVFPLA
jgi:two-component system phosphate regulon sensor histidine kinase PhoR